MIEIEKPNITTAEQSDDGSYGTFVIEPLERGFGQTLGNSLRRVLLSSLPGYAVTNIKIDGVLHEFSTIPGVTEDVTEIVLNVKGIIAKLHCQGPKTVFIDVNELAPNPLQPRRVFDRDELESLANSIKTYGLIQPIAVKRITPLPHPMPSAEA